MKEKERRSSSGARTSDWIGQVKDRILHAYDLGSSGSEGTGSAGLTKEDFEQVLKKVSRKLTSSAPARAKKRT